MTKDYCIGMYLRLSSEDIKTSDCDSNSIISQRERIKDYIHHHPELKNGTIKEYIDDGISGTNFNRKAVKALIEDAKYGKINCVIVKDFSRFGRNYIETGTYMEKIFPFLGIRFISINDSYDSHELNHNSGDIDVVFKNVVHDFYSRDLSKKIVTAKRAGAKQGKHMTAYAPYGFIKNEEKRLIPDEVSADVVKRIFSMRLEGKGTTAIAEALNKEGILSPLMLRKKRKNQFPCNSSKDMTYWRGSRIQAILKDRRYVGDAVYGKYLRKEIGSKKDRLVPETQWIVVEDAHEALVSRKDFNKVQSLFKHYAKKTKKKNVELFTSKIKYAGCINKPIDDTIIEKVVLLLLQKFKQLTNYEIDLNQDRQEKLWKYARTIKGYCNSLQQLQNRRFDNYKAYKCGSLSVEVFKQQNSSSESKEVEIRNKIKEVNGKIELLKLAIETSENIVRDTDILKPFNEVTREMVDVFIDHIIIEHKNKIIIVWNFEDSF